MKLNAGVIMRILIMILYALLASATIAAARDDRPIGMVETVSGDAYIQRNDQRLAAQPGSELFLGDVLSTGSNGAVGVILRDDTVLSLGPSSETRLEQFAFDPAEHKLGMLLRVTRGLFSYVSGRISKLSPGSVRIETPVATLGIRGTRLVARIVP
ncbi:MAG: FecR domain-containing protein [Desulfobacteraceae bacterium]|nr:FecR domain-containing protein [Desulfobacteraceae bacterium]